MCVVASSYSVANAEIQPEIGAPVVQDSRGSLSGDFGLSGFRSPVDEGPGAMPQDWGWYYPYYYYYAPYYYTYYYFAPFYPAFYYYYQPYFYFGITI